MKPSSLWRNMLHITKSYMKQAVKYVCICLANSSFLQWICSHVCMLHTVWFSLTSFHFDAVRGSRCNSSCQVWNTERGNSTLSCPHLTPVCVCVCMHVCTLSKVEAYRADKMKTTENTLCKVAFHLSFEQCFCLNVACRFTATNIKLCTAEILLQTFT